MPLTTATSVPLVRRQLAAQPAKFAATVLAVAASVALVLLLAGLRRGLSDQVTLYLDRQPPVVVGQAGMRDFLSQTSVLPERVAQRLERVPGVARAVPVSQQFAMLNLHGKRVLALLIGYDRARGGGPWSLAAGHEPIGPGELVVDRLLAEQHQLRAGSLLRYRGTALHVVGLSNGTGGFMTPLAFATRQTVNALGAQPRTANFFFVEPSRGVAAATVAERIRQTVPGVSALPRDRVARSDRALFAGAFSGPLLAMVAIALAAAALVVGLAVYGSTVERRREYATLKALGLRGRSLVALAAGSALATAGAGALIGVAAAVAGREAAERIAPQYLVVISPGAAVASVAAAVAVAVVASLLPARYLVRLDPEAAFRR